MQSIKEHNLKANHNPPPAPPFDFFFCMQSIKEHNLKANHNRELSFRQSISLYAIYQRTQSESKSQPLPYSFNLLSVCMQSIKEHNLKANHNTQ